MERVIPEHSRNQVNAAGATLIDQSASLEERERARRVVNNWRAAHSFPLNTLQVNLRRYVSDYGDEALVAQRLKRLSSIEEKLRRFDRMRLSRMQDIGGCRAVLPSVADVRDVVSTFEKSRARHELLRRSDYLAEPRESGYRGVHLIYAYRSGSEQNAVYGGMQVEIQLRTQLQHTWSTAVETVDTFTEQNLKASRGSKDWLSLFALMGSYIAQKENLPVVPDTPRSQSALRNAISSLALQIDAIAKLEAYGEMVKIMQNLDDAVKTHRRIKFSYFHIRIKVTNDDSAQVRWRGYSQDQRHKAIQAYEETEENIQNVDREETVLVRASSIEDLKRAYPNYFVNTSVFVEELRKAIS